jgi:hypothetical protein
LSQTGVLSGSPTAHGSFSFVVRATDENGLFDDLADAIPVVLPMLLSASASATVHIIRSPDGVDWDGAPVSSSTANKAAIYGIEGGRYFSNGVASATPARYSDDDGATWTNTVANVTQGQGICYSNGRLLLGAYLSGMLISTDRGQTFTTSANTTGLVNNLKYDSEVVCGLSNGQAGSQASVSLDGGDIFGSPVSHGMDFTTGGYIGTDGVAFYLCAQIGGNPALKKFTVGGVLTTETLPTLSAGLIRAFAASDEVKVTATSAGQICVNDAGSWELLPFAFPYSCHQLFWNGAAFIALCAPGGGAPGKIYTSPNGRTWTESPMAGAYTPNTVAQQAPDV